MQELIVGILVAYAAWVVTKRYAPKPVRLATRKVVVRLARRVGWKTLEEKFNAKPQVSGSCGDGCSSCGSCESAAPTPSVKQFTITPQALKQTIVR